DADRRRDRGGGGEDRRRGHQGHRRRAARLTAPRTGPGYRRGRARMARGGYHAGERLVRLARLLPALAEGAEVPAETGGPVGTIQARAVGLRREAHAL